MIGFCRPWIISAGEWLKPLHELTKEEAEEPLRPNHEQIKAFKALKESLIRAPALGLPNYSKPFELYVHEVKGVASGVLTQAFGNAPRPVAYLSGQLDPVAKGHPGCLRNVAAAALLVEKAQEIVLGHPLTGHKLLMEKR
uniref:Reverse transcriptase/retrotransposon-derived protein RNase H-like domain-containing protein n=1 Tax=Terrapene triunguis TaxID=2587831 RepID=A0A674II74_9SAUR